METFTIKHNTPSAHHHGPHQPAVLQRTPETGSSDQWLLSRTSGIPYPVGLQTRHSSESQWPDHLFISPNTPTRKYTATRTKAKDSDSDDTMVRSDMEKAPLEARATTEDLPLGFALDQMVHNAQKIDNQTIRQWQMAHTLSKSGDLWTKDGAFIVVGNNTLKRGVISLFHDSTMAGHPRISKALALMKPYYWWPNMKNFIMEYIKGCTTCQVTKVNTQPTRPPCF